jgi:hypothetical protein
LADRLLSFASYQLSATVATRHGRHGDQDESIRWWIGYRTRFSRVKSTRNVPTLNRYSRVFAVSFFTSRERLVCSASRRRPTLRRCSLGKALSYWRTSAQIQNPINLDHLELQSR